MTNVRDHAQHRPCAFAGSVSTGRGSGRGGAPGAGGSTPGTYGYGQTRKSGHLAPSRRPAGDRARQAGGRCRCVLWGNGCVCWLPPRPRGKIIRTSPNRGRVKQSARNWPAMYPGAAMTTEDSQPIRRSAFSSRDPEETTEFFRQMYVDNHTSFRDVGERGECGARSAATPTVRADRVGSTPFTVDITGDPLGYVLFGQLQRGSWKVHAGGEQARLGPGDTVLYPTDAPFRVTATDFDFAVVSLPLRRLGVLAAEHTDLHSAELRFESMAPVSAAMRRHVTNTLTMIHTELSHSDSAATHPLVAEQLAHAAATAVLAGFPNTSMNTARASGSGRVPPAAIRRATDFIEAHAVEPLTLSDIAHASGVKPRALQAG